jgi:hypothetical protein
LRRRLGAVVLAYDELRPRRPWQFAEVNMSKGTSMKKEKKKPKKKA